MIEGGCACGAVRYALALEHLPAVYCCHCTRCQRSTGSAFVEHAFVATASMTVTGGPACYEAPNPSGSSSRQFSCPTCHTRLWNENNARPGFATVRAGTFDRSREVDPCAHIWTQSKQPWVLLTEDVPQFAQMAPLPEFMAALSNGANA